MKPARIIILAVAVVSAGVAGLLALQIARGGKPSIEMQKVVEREPTINVLVAKESLPVGARLNPDVVAWAPWPQGSIVEGFITDQNRPDAVDKLNANSEMRASMRDQIAAALKAEIARLEMKSVKAFAKDPSGAKSEALAGITALPPLPQPKPAQTMMLPPPPATAPAAPRRDYAALPPLPTNPVAPTRVLPGGVASLAAVLPRPRMSFICFTPGEAEGPCTGFTRYTLLTVRAGEDLPADTSLRFVRDGDPQAEVKLAQLKKGKSVRMTIPVDVCRHTVGGKLELRIVRSGQEVGSDGPYNLSC